MPEKQADFPDALSQREKALSRWDAEGGAGPLGPQQNEASSGVMVEFPELSNAELVRLRVRVIALENLMIALLAQASEKQLGLAREMATFISPRAGSTQHPLTIHAAGQMNDLVDRAFHFKDMAPS